MSQESPAATDKKVIKTNKPFFKRPRFWLISFFVLLSLPLLAVAGVYFALKSSLVETQVWPRLQPIIAEQTGFQVELSHLRIDLLNSIHIKGIQVTQLPDTANPNTLNCDGFNLSLAEVGLDFSALALMGKHLEINKLVLNDLQATGCLLLDLDAEAEVVELDASDEALDIPALLADITELLDNPPLSLSLKELALNNFKIDVQVKERQQQLAAAWQGGFNFSAAATWQDKGIDAKINSQLNSLAPLSLAINQTPALNLDLTTQADLDLNLALALTKQQGAWQFKLTPAQVQFNLANTQLNLVQPEETLDLNLPSYSLTLNSQVNLPDIQKEALEVSIQLEQLLTDLNLAINEDFYQLEELALQLSSHNDANKILANLQLNIKQLATEFSFQPIDFEQKLNLELIQDLSHLELNAFSQLNQIDLAKLSLLVNNQPHELNLQPQLVLNLPIKLAEILTEPSLKELPGDLHLSLTADTRINHSADNLLNTTLNEDLEQLTGFLEQSLNLTLSQNQPNTDLKILQPLLVKLQLSTPFPELQPDLRLNLSSAAIQHPPLLKPLPFELQLASQIEAGFKALKTQLELFLDNQAFAKLDLQAAKQAEQINLNGFLDLSFNPSLENFLADLKPLAEFGHLTLNQQFQMQLNHPEADALALAASELDINQLAVELKHGLQLSQEATLQAEVRLNKPFKLQQTLHWRAEALSLDGTYQFAALELPDLLTAENLNMSLQLNAASGLAPQHLDWVFNTQVDSLVWLEETPPLELSQLLPLTSQGSISFNPTTEELTIKQLSLALNEWFKQQLSGEVQLANLEKPSLQLQGHTQLAPNKELIPNLELTTSGSLSAPWQLMLNQGEQVSLQAQLEFNDFSLAMDDISLEGLQGAISINEELRLSPEEKLSFYYLLKPEAFQRVDFNQIEPYLMGNKGFSLTKLKFDDIEVGPLQARFKVQQNLIELPQFSLQLLAGNLAGQFYLDVTPNAWRLGLLSRISQLDLRRLLPKRATSDYAPISARTALEFDFNQRLLAGRLDITDITRSQLLQLLELVDPEFIDPQINNVRSALRLAHPEWISAVMQNGLMDLTFGLSLFSEPLRAHGLPLSPIIERFGEEALLLPDQLPLE